MEKLNKKRTNITVGELEDVYRYLTKNEVKRLSFRPRERRRQRKKTNEEKVLSIFGLKEDCIGLPWEEVFAKKIKEEKRAFIKKALKTTKI